MILKTQRKHYNRPKADCRHTFPQGGGIAAGVFVEARALGFQKSPELHLQTQAKYPKFHPQTPKSG